MVKMSPWWGLRVWQKWIRAFVAWPALTAARFPSPFFRFMLESSAALCPELGLNTVHCTETNMEKNPNSSSSTKVPPRSSSTGPAPSESKPKTGEHIRKRHKYHMRLPNTLCALVAKHPLPCGLLGPSRTAEVVYLVWLRTWRSCQNIWPTSCHKSTRYFYPALFYLFFLWHDDTFPLPSKAANVRK